MPTRIIREGIITSETVNRLSHDAELFYRRLMSVADDYGRYYSHPSILRANCFPLQLDTVDEVSVKKWLEECISAQVIELYGDASKFLQVFKFGQQTRSRSKFPEPPKELIDRCLSFAKHSSTTLTSAPTTTTTSPTDKMDRPTIEAVLLQGAKGGLPESECRKFFDFYESKGWKVGNQPMKSWTAAVSNWMRRWLEQGGTIKTKPLVVLADVQALCKDKWGDDSRHVNWALSFYSYWNDPTRNWKRNGVQIDWKVELSKQVSKWRTI